MMLELGLSVGLELVDRKDRAKRRRHRCVYRAMRNACESSKKITAEKVGVEAAEKNDKPHEDLVHHDGDEMDRDEHEHHRQGGQDRHFVWSTNG